MNRLQHIRVTNQDILFPKRKHNNDFNWDNSTEERRPTRNLHMYTADNKVIEAWKEGIKMGQNLARE